MTTLLLRKQTLYLIAAFIGLVGSVVYLTQYGESGKLGIAPASVEALRDADSYLLQPSGTKYNQDGRVIYQWRAHSAERLASGEVRLNQPFYTGLLDAQREWTAEASRGVLAADGQALNLSDEVIVRELIHQARIDTDALRIDLHSNQVTTERPVRLSLPSGHTTSVGLRADLAQQQLELLNQVRGVYVLP